ncbi:DUF3089 domain-containing protein [Nocardioides sp.]|uniref:DUF3089 domain-containing protein n=1 Tax=Nocardioides sp. TaxID=35761 RepID=UPI002B26F087|nr:DUF3089 domain-containing protein [Nocardioides sp.]
MLLLLVALGLIGLVVPAGAASAETRWLCHPGLPDDPCRGDQTTTAVRADGSAVVRRPRVPRRAGVDCFYVYPTSSEQPTPNARRRSEASVEAVARQQAQRFSTVCRTFAPLYRQRTLAALAAEKAFTEEQRGDFYRLAYVDVLRAWRAYLAEVGPERQFVLVGHSQGSRLLRKLIAEEIDPRRSMRQRLVSAVLPGADVVVRRGRDRGGDFEHLRLCRSSRQLHCVMAWSAYGETPPDDSRFGKPPTDDAASPGLDLPVGRRLEVACTNPASLAANRRVQVRTVVRSERLPGLLGLLQLQLYGGPPPSAETPWLVPADRYTARCARTNGTHVLRVRPVGDAQQLNPAPDDTWGLHIADVNLVLGDVLHVVRRQVARLRP